MFAVQSLEEARANMQAQFGSFAPPVETIPLPRCLDRILAQDVTSGEDVPDFDRSTMDGYAVIARDTFGASEAMPAMLNLAGEVLMGEVPPFVIQPGQCAYIPTGGQLPAGADSVVMVEHTTKMDDGTIFIETPVSPGNHLVFTGDDVKKGEMVLRRGRRIKSQDIGTLAALGVSQVPVFCRPKVGVLSTGNELVEIDQPLQGASVRDVNSYALSGGIERAGGQPVRYGIVEDNWNSLQAALHKALDECDMALISGGSSVGVMDMTHKLINEAGSPGVFVHGIAVKPGKPTIIGNVNGKPVFGLPGHPVSAFLIYQVVAAPLLCQMAGAGDPLLFRAAARLTDKIPSGGGREEFVPVSLSQKDGQLTATPLRYKSGLISYLSKTDGFVHVGRNREGVPKGELVEILPIG